MVSALVMKLAALGANIILASRSKDKLEAVVRNCTLISPAGKFMVVIVGSSCATGECK